MIKLSELIHPSTVDRHLFLVRVTVGGASPTHTVQSQSPFSRDLVPKFTQRVWIVQTVDQVWTVQTLRTMWENVWVLILPQSHGKQ